MKNILRILFILFLLICQSYANKDINVTLDLSVNKSHLEIGDEVLFTYKLTNHSNEDISVYFMALFTNHLFNFYNIDHQEKSLKHTVIYKIKTMPTSKKEFKTIKANSSLKKYIKAIYDQGEIRYLNMKGISPYQGKYLYFPKLRSYLLLENDHIIFNATYKVFSSHIKKAKELGVNNLFYKKIQSKKKTLYLK